MITVDKFIDGYNRATDKEKYVKKHIVNDYVPYIDKVAGCKSIIKDTCYKEINGKDVYWRNGIGMDYALTTRLLLKYTDLDLRNESIIEDETLYGKAILDNFELLKKNNLLNVIMSNIPENEVKEWNLYLSIADDDEEYNVNSLQAMISTKLEALSLTFGTIFDSFGTVLENPEVQSKIVNMIK